MDDDLARPASRARSGSTAAPSGSGSSDGKIAEVRAYHHGDKKNPQGDLLGFDHAGRGHTTIDDWKPPKKKAHT